MSADPRPDPAAGDAVRAYHARTKHRLQRYAAGPETLDWDAQPDPWRRFDGAPLTLLPLAADALGARWDELAQPGAVVPAVPGLAAVAALLELSFGLTAWKQLGPDRWALRANPSSGNLHPTEAYLVARAIPGLADGVHHYAPREHALELRCALAPLPGARPALWLATSAIAWREAWKYGERAFRYVQLDSGHALGAAAYAAAALGWRALRVDGLASDRLERLLGLGRDEDFADAERERPEWLLQLQFGALADADAVAEPPAAAWLADGSWQGQANRLDPRPMYRWPVIDEVERASRDAGGGTHAALELPPPPDLGALGPAPQARLPAATLIRQRRSAQRFDRRARLPAAAFFRIVAALLPAALPPWTVWPRPPRVHPVFFVHRVDGLAPGAYLLPRHADALPALQAAVGVAPPWPPADGAPAGLPLLRLAENPALAGTLRTLSCHQAIAADAGFAVALLAEFDAPLAAAPAAYRELLQECGLLGQVLYLQAEAEGLRGTGIGCYFDDEVHGLLALADAGLQVLYHFTVGQALDDERLLTEPPYAHLSHRELAP